SQPEFETQDAEALRFLARQVGSVLSRLALHAELERAAADADRSLSGPATEVYREEALRHHVAAGEHGDLLRLSGRWMGWSYRLIALSSLAGLVYLWSGRVNVYATGMAVVRLEQRADGHVAALLPGNLLPKLRPGLPLWITLSGFPSSPQR